MFERFTERARNAVVLAQDSARQHGHGYVGTEHLLCGLLREEEGLASKVLAARGLTVSMLDADITSIVGEGEVKPTPQVPGGIPFTTNMRKALELALREALSLGHNYIGSEHILLGLVRVSERNEGLAARILERHGLGGDELRMDVIAKLGGPTERARQDEARALAARLIEDAEARRGPDTSEDKKVLSPKLTVEDRLARIEAYLGIPR